MRACAPPPPPPPPTQAASTPMKLKRAAGHAIELDDDVVVIFLHVMSVKVGRLSQASANFSVLSDSGGAAWALRIRMMKHVTGMCQPDLYR